MTPPETSVDETASSTTPGDSSTKEAKGKSSQAPSSRQDATACIEFPTIQ